MIKADKLTIARHCCDDLIRLLNKTHPTINVDAIATSLNNIQ